MVLYDEKETDKLWCLNSKFCVDFSESSFPTFLISPERIELREPLFALKG